MLQLLDIRQEEKTQIVVIVIYLNIMVTSYVPISIFKNIIMISSSSIVTTHTKYRVVTEI